jgi:hypothetical protein
MVAGVLPRITRMNTDGSDSVSARPLPLLHRMEERAGERRLTREHVPKSWVVLTTPLPALSSLSEGEERVSVSRPLCRNCAPPRRKFFCATCASLWQVSGAVCSKVRVRAEGLRDPETADDHRGGTGTDRQATIEFHPARSTTACGQTHRPREARHCGNGAGCECGEVADGLNLSGKSKHR